MVTSAAAVAATVRKRVLQMLAASAAEARVRVHLLVQARAAGAASDAMAACKSACKLLCRLGRICNAALVVTPNTSVGTILTWTI